MLNQQNTSTDKTVIDFIKRNWGCGLILLTIIGFVSKSWYNYPMTVMAVIGLCQCLKSPLSIWHDNKLRFYVITFICLWAPLLIALIDAVNIERSARTVFPYLRFLFAGIFIINAIGTDREKLKTLISGIFFIVTFWCLDASLQFFAGKNLVGFPYRDGDITGMFHPRNTIAHICSILSTFIFIYCVERKNMMYSIIGILPLFFIILLSGRRAAWIMLALSSIGYLACLYFYSKEKLRLIKYSAALFVVISLIFTTTVALHEPLKTRLLTTMGLFTTDYETIDKATALRLPLWETGLAIFKVNPINGIGPRGYRYVYNEYSGSDNFWHGPGQTHPHLLLLEIAVETGLIGLTGYLLLFYLTFRQVSATQNKQFIMPVLIPMLVAIFPFNAHMAFYGSIWSTMVWLLTAIFISSLRIDSNPT